VTDKITRLPTRPRLARCTGPVPSECPDAPHVRLDGLRKRTGKPLSLPADLVDGDALERAGFGRGIPHAREDARESELREMRERVLAMAKSAGTREQCHRQMAEADMLERVELESVANWLAEQIGDDEPPKGAA
jgi:hypothetical protein